MGGSVGEADAGPSRIEMEWPRGASGGPREGISPSRTRVGVARAAWAGGRVEIKPPREAMPAPREQMRHPWGGGGVGRGGAACGRVPMRPPRAQIRRPREERELLFTNKIIASPFPFLLFTQKRVVSPFSSSICSHRIANLIEQLTKRILRALPQQLYSLSSFESVGLGAAGRIGSKAL